jgi:hypothetical protein|tara:strand:- start:1587 stop:1805 length:219 start_codon:yes stop_codon:yes gene_type:complete
VVDSEDQPIIGAYASTYVGSNMRWAVTNLDGYFTIRPLPVGTYDLTITSSSFDTIKLVGIKVKGDGIFFLKN